jgi:hypothetical protein
MAGVSSPFQATSTNHNLNNLSSPVAEPAPTSRSVSHADNYFPQSPSQQQHQQLSQTYPENSVLAPAAAEDVTRINTIANTNPHASPLAAPLATRPPKFTEEWDASQRGSSVIDGPASNMHRTNSYAGSIGPSEGNHAMALSRGNTLKKKASIRRSGSLKRSGSRRSMKAGSVKSLALQSSNDPDEMHSAFYCPVPTTGNPTEALANRFQGILPLALVNFCLAY